MCYPDGVWFATCLPEISLLYFHFASLIVCFLPGQVHSVAWPAVGWHSGRALSKRLPKRIFREPLSSFEYFDYITYNSLRIRVLWEPWSAGNVVIFSYHGPKIRCRFQLRKGCHFVVLSHAVNFCCTVIAEHSCSPVRRDGYISLCIWDWLVSHASTCEIFRESFDHLLRL